MTPVLKARLLSLSLLAALAAGACAFSVAPTSSDGRQLTLKLAAFPDNLPAESDSASAEIWATVKQGDTPVRDSTRVAFATTVGTITAVSLTQDGLAVALLAGPGDGRPRRAQIVAQAVTVRDTLEVNFVLFDE